MSSLGLSRRVLAVASLGAFSLIVAGLSPTPVAAAPKNTKQTTKQTTPTKQTKKAAPSVQAPPTHPGLETPKHATVVTMKPKAKPASGTTSPKLPAKLRKRLAKTKPLPKAGKLDVLRSAGLIGGGVQATTHLTIRRPYASSHAFLSLVGASAVNPAEGRKGTAKIRGDMRDTQSEFGDPFANNPLGLPNPPPPDHGVVVDFRADKDKHYLVECPFQSPERPAYLPATLYQPLRDSDFYTQVRDGGTEFEGGLAVRDHLVIQTVPARSSSRRVVVKIKADRGFLTTGCSITPVTSG